MGEGTGTVKSTQRTQRLLLLQKREVVVQDFTKIDDSVSHCSHQVAI